MSSFCNGPAVSRERRIAASLPASSVPLRERARREARLAAIEAILCGAPDGLALCFERAQLLDGLGHSDAARQAYIEVLQSDSAHAGALNDLGRLLDRTGFHTAARTAYARAVAAQPDDATSHGNLASSLLDAGDTEAARRHYEIALRLDPDNVAAHACLAVLLLRLGDAPGAAAHGRAAFRAGATAWPYRGAGEPIPVLVLHSALGGNISIDRYIDDRTFAKWTCVAEFWDPAAALPPHAFVFNAIGDADRCAVALRAAEAILAKTAAPIVNSPGRIRSTGRRVNARRLARLPGVIAPRIITCTRAHLRTPDAVAELASAGFEWPLIVRAPGFHTGRHCSLVKGPEELAEAVSSLPGTDVFVIQYIEVRAPDGTFRKYRVIVVDGALFPLHLAISTHWKVHYFTADMIDRPEHRAEEAAFLADMSGAIGAPATAALGTIARRLGLDYGGIDFALDAAGRVVVFEANATMIAPPPPSDERWAYRRGPVERIDAAVRTMLLARAGVSATR
jgi:hypothetical protein